ncbi:glucosyl-dolichyl phosphate glucuronosyltransferase [Halorarius litoreus]|uniref:glucosyl-dolichyl phosphate glucuronosyltransferase n=1 Tax=Halorarius litoreus TaxID=2962676 RepID=UPI0020CD333B|nr:glucosyl-dolichyl phosphate glucuronosyltransferase [Halorarius litoreus]
MKVSVVLCTYSLDRYEEFSEAADSILDQTHDDVELVVVVDGTEEVYDRVLADYGDHEDTVIHCNDRNRGLSHSRNVGAELASGDVVAFLDDDAVAAPDWAEKIVSGYERYDALAVGGKMVPDWLAGEPSYLPAEFYFLIGVTYRGFREDEGYVRNTFSSNLSFRRGPFLELEGFKTHMGKRGENNLQGGETELCVRLEREYGERVLYIPDAEIEHKIYDYRTGRRWLLERAFWQGYSKRRMEEMDSEGTETERAFVGKLFSTFIPDRIAELVREPTAERAGRLVMLLVLTGATGIGYGYALAKSLLE